ncbi:MAG: hypothetical protein JNM88_04580 [Chitinophagaceae bacterium]|nr:hypothetical protein [Chitinophagaceae bacterium]
MKVLITDGSIEIIERLQQALCETEHVSAVYGSVSYRDGYSFFRDIKPSVMLIDSRLADNECERLVKDARSLNDNTNIIVLLNGEDKHQQEKLLALGATRLMDKYHDFENIPGVVNRIAAEIKEARTNGTI